MIRISSGGWNDPKPRSLDYKEVLKWKTFSAYWVFINGETQQNNFVTGGIIHLFGGVNDAGMRLAKEDEGVEKAAAFIKEVSI